MRDDMQVSRGPAAVVAATRSGAALLIAMLVVHASAPTHAQSEFLGRLMPYEAFDALPKTALEVPGGVLQVGFAPGELALPKSRILDWIKDSAEAVALYYGRFPVGAARVLIVPVEGRGVRGQAFGYQGAAIRIRLGRDASERDLERDWVMVHEMVHLALPDLDERHNWLSEGIATYVEPIARAQAGDLTSEAVWAAFVRDIPQGLPQAGDRGLDNTPTWGRTYWGGAMFCLLADIEIRKRTNNRLGLQHALRGILAAGGSHEEDWPIRRVLAAADAATGLNVLSELYDGMRAKPVHPDLDALWRDLGIRPDGNGVTFDAAAPLAAAREALTKRTPP